MIILWIRKNKGDKPSRHYENDVASFQKHDESMRRFRLAHPSIETTKLKDVSTTDWLALIPMRKVELARYSQN